MDIAPLTEVLVFEDGFTDPEIPSGTCVILVQEGFVKVGRLVFLMDEIEGLRIDHPKNEEELNEKAKMIIQKERAAALEQEDATVYTCPPELEEEMQW